MKNGIIYEHLASQNTDTPLWWVSVFHSTIFIYSHTKKENETKDKSIQMKYNNLFSETANSSMDEHDN